MKKLLGLVVILAALVLGGYYGMGIITERTVKHNLEVINTSNGLYVNIAEYHRGWFTSNAILDWRLHVPEHVIKSDDNSSIAPAQDYEMRMPLTIHHGPIIFANRSVKFGLGYANTDIPMPEKYKEQFQQQFTADSTQPSLDLSLFVTYLNSSQIEISVPEFKLMDKDGGQFDWMGMDSSVKVNSHADKIKGDINFSGMQFKKGDTSAVTSEVTSDYDLHKTTEGLYLGDANLSLPSFVVNNKDQKVFELNDLDMRTSSDIDDGLFSMHFKTSVDKIVANGKSYGPGDLEMAVRNLDAVVLGHVNQQLNIIQNGTDAEKQQAMFALVPEVPKLFSRGAEFEVSELSFAIPEGTIEGNLFISLPQGETTNPMELMQKVEGKSKLKFPKALLKMALDESNKRKMASTPIMDTTAAPTTDAQTSTQPVPADSNQVGAMSQSQIDNFVQTGLLVEDGDYYVIQAELKQGQVQVNGKPFSQEMLKF